jgi:hypothetical protein
MRTPKGRELRGPFVLFGLECLKVEIGAVREFGRLRLCPFHPFNRFASRYGLPERQSAKDSLK